MGPSVLAPYGTKVGALVKPKAVTNYLDLTNIDDRVCSPFDAETLSPASAIDAAADAAWRSDIAVGTLLDARDLQNVWYQVSRTACVCLLRLPFFLYHCCCCYTHRCCALRNHVSSSNCFAAYRPV